jgi:hypothetical protein
MGDRFDERCGWPSIDDPQVEALLTGREVSADLAPLAAVVGALKEAAAQPAPPAPSLALQISTGTFGDGEVVPPPTRSGDGRLPGGWWIPAPPGWTPEVTEMQPRLAARTASVGVVIVLLGVGTAGFHNALPEPAQVRFERVVETVTPYEFPERTAGGEGSGVERSVPDEDGDPDGRGDFDGHGDPDGRMAAGEQGATAPAVPPERVAPGVDAVDGDEAGDGEAVGHGAAAGEDGDGNEGVPGDESLPPGPAGSLPPVEGGAGVPDILESGHPTQTGPPAGQVDVSGALLVGPPAGAPGGHPAGVPRVMPAERIPAHAAAGDEASPDS